MSRQVLFPATQFWVLALGLFFGLFAPFLSLGTTYFVSPSGNDTHPGTSPAQAWQTLAKVNLTPIQAGDSILLEAGQSFTGSLYFGNLHATALQPLYIGSWGTGKATIHSGTNYGMQFYNCEGIEIRNLHLIGDGRILNNNKGIYVYGDQTGTRLTHFVIDSVEVQGYNRGGISFGDDGNLSGFAEVRITHTVAHDNGDHGIEIERPFSATGTYYPHKNIYIAHCHAYQNAGQIGKYYHHTGNGIMVGNADSVVIEYSLAHHNGSDNTYWAGGPVGIWVWDSNKALIQYNESHHNQTASAKDGGGFDLDGGTTHSIIQYNYSHDNAGAGYLLAQFASARPMSHNHIRYNISQNDGRVGDYGAIHLWRTWGTVMDSIYVYNNTVFVGPSPTGTPKAFYADGGGVSDINMVNNIFISVGGPELVRKTHQYSDFDFFGNVYYAIGGPFTIEDGGTFSSLANWRNQNGQEELQNGTPVGYEGDPLLVSMGAGTTIGNPLQLTQNLGAYQLSAGSPLQDMGLSLDTLFNLNVGNVDFFQATIPVNLAYDIGAAEGSGNPLSLRSLSWQAERQSPSQVALRWEIPKDLAAVSVELERRSAKQRTFHLIESFSTVQEDWLDHQAPNEFCYYRLALLLADGTKQYFPIRQVKAMARELTSLQLYPNPVKEVLQIPIPADWTGTAHWEIFSTAGRRMLMGETADLTTYREWEIGALSTLPPGIYWVQFATEENQLSGRFVKQ